VNNRIHHADHCPGGGPFSSQKPAVAPPAPRYPGSGQAARIRTDRPASIYNVMDRFVDRLMNPEIEPLHDAAIEQMVRVEPSVGHLLSMLREGSRAATTAGVRVTGFTSGWRALWVGMRSTRCCAIASATTPSSRPSSRSFGLAPVLGVSAKWSTRKIKSASKHVWRAGNDRISQESAPTTRHLPTAADGSRKPSRPDRPPRGSWRGTPLLPFRRRGHAPNRPGMAAARQRTCHVSSPN
jgi:hypothetical protein